MSLDLYFFEQVNSFAGRYLWLDAIAIFFAQYLGYVVLFCLALFLLKNFAKNLRMVTEAIFSGILAKEIFVDIIRHLFPRDRPFIQDHIYSLIEHAVTPAFPSAHTAFYFAIGTSIYLYKKRAGTLFLLAASLIALGRVFSGVHWFSDILAGSLIGALSAFIINKVAKKFPRKQKPAK